MVSKIKNIPLSAFVDIVVVTVLLANLAYPINNMLIVYLWASLVLTNITSYGTIILLKLKLKYKYKNISDKTKKEYSIITIENYRFFNLMITMLEILSMSYLLIGYYFVLKVLFVLFSIIVLYLWNIASNCLIDNKIMLEEMNKQPLKSSKFYNINEELKGDYDNENQKV